MTLAPPCPGWHLGFQNYLLKFSFYFPLRFIYLNSLCMNVFLHLWVCNICMPDAYKVKRGCWIPCNSWQMVVSCHWVLGTELGFSVRARSVLNCWAISAVCRSPPIILISLMKICHRPVHSINLFFFVWFSEIKFPLYSPGCPVDQAGLERWDLPASASCMLGLKVCACSG